MPSGLLPLPPLAEQGRIVAKVAELMPLCNERENQIFKTEIVSLRLLEAALQNFQFQI